MENFKLTKLPMPPSSNHQYWHGIMNGKGGGKVARPIPTSELKAFQKEMAETWKNANLIAIYKARALLRGWMMKGLYIEVETFAFFNYFDLFTQEGQVRRMDGSNRIKALHDSLAEVLEIDDSWFWDTIIRKREIHGKEPWCAVIFRPVEHMNLKTMKERNLI